MSLHSLGFLKSLVKHSKPINNLLCKPPLDRWIRADKRYILSAAVTRRLDLIVKRHEEIMKAIEGDSSGDSYTFGKELSSLSQAVSLHQKSTAMDEEERSIRELLDEAMRAKDREMEEECRQALDDLKTDRVVLEKRILNAILPKDEDDYFSDAILEVRAGTGGDEACLFASELLEAYIKTAKVLKWNIEILSESRTDLGGIREAVVSLSSQTGMSYGMDQVEDEDFRSTLGPYGLLKYESGVHRVQRVPINDTKIQTSACSVAVLPLLQNEKNSDGLLPMTELRIETMRSSGAGGQHVNTTESAVRITHIPTGITASIQDARSQHKNKEKALKLVTARVRDRQRMDAERQRGELKSSLMGGGDRSERIRTYNYPQDRVTDHRCKQTAHGIQSLLSGGMDDGLVVTFFPFLRDMNRDEIIRQLEDAQG